MVSHSRNGKGTGTEQPCLEVTEGEANILHSPVPSNLWFLHFPRAEAARELLHGEHAYFQKTERRGTTEGRSLWVGLQGSSVRGEWKTGGMSTFYPVSPLGSPENYRFWFQANGHKAEQRRLQLLKNNSQKIKKYTYDTAVYTVYISLLTYKTMRLNGRFYLTKISIIACVNGISRYLLLEHTWNCLFLLGICLGYLHDYHASLPTFPVGSHGGTRDKS